MKISKKISLIASLTLVLIALGLLVPKLALAAPSPSEAEACANNLSFDDVAHISCDVAGLKIIFTDREPTDGDFNYAASISSSAALCQRKEDSIDLNGMFSLDSMELVVSRSPVHGSVTIHYTESGKTGCQTLSGHSDQLIHNSSNILNILKGGDNSISSLPGVSKGQLSNLSYSRYLNAANDPTNGNLLFGDEVDLPSCSGSIVAVDSSGAVAQEYKISNGGDSFGKYDDLNGMPQDTGCGISKTNFDLGNVDAGLSFHINPNIKNIENLGGSLEGQQCGPGTKYNDPSKYKGYNCRCIHDESGGQSCTLISAASTGVGANANSDINSACESRSFSFNWAICPLIGAVDDIMKGVNKTVEDQLNFNTKEFLNDHVKQAWSVFRSLASTLVVLLMLIMIISQAVGGGPFDAYTLRKLLPRLVFVVIVMQISWELSKYVIDLANDAGKGVSDLLALPFGGPSKLTLQSLVGQIGGLAPAGSILTAMLAATGIAIFNPFLILFVAFGIFMAVMTALAVLLFRQILILACVILAPVALLLWVLPGTQRYWKLWWDNFSKALLLFPIITAMIVTGRIFAWIVATSAGGAPGIFAWFAIIIGFFGPYFLLPKAFKWGGQLMSAAGNGINSAMKPVKDFGNKEVKEAGQRYQGRYAKKYDPSDTRFNRGLNRFRSGHFIPSKRSQRLAIAKGDKYQQEQDEMSLALLKRDGEKAMAGYATFFRNDDGTLVKVRRNAQGQMLDKDNNVTDDAKEAALRMQNTAGQFLDVNGQVVAKREDAAYVTTEDEAEAGTRTLTGVQAMKQRWVDLMDDDKADASVKKMAARQLVATSSWPEIQGSFTTKGRRVIDTDDWSKSITTSPDDYPRVLRSRVDATPHIDDGAKKALAIEIERRSNNNLPPLTEIQQRRFLSQNRVQYSIQKQMGNEDFATQSDGYWAEVARMSTVTRDMTSDEAQRALEIQQHLRDRFKAIHDIGGTAPQQLLGHLMDGGPLQKNVQQALGGIDLSTYIGSGPPHPPPTGPVVPTP